MREWKKPELYVEEFELNQHVAYGCGTKISGTVNGYVTVNVMCTQPNNSSHILTGDGHYGDETVTINDTNGNGKIDWSEVETQFDSVARNGKQTGLGHLKNHNGQIVVDGKQYDFNVDKPFTS